jgi:hypothetical protein
MAGSFALMGYDRQDWHWPASPQDRKACTRLEVVMTRTLIAAAMVAWVAAAPGATQQKEWSFPDTRSSGRATTEYRHEGLHIAINYDYSQRNHETRWLLVDLAAASRQRFVLHKSDITLTTPDGRTLAPASQQAILDDGAGITQLLQNARIWRRPLATYFSQRAGLEEPLRFHAFPPGRSTTSDEAIVDDDRLTIGPLLFRTPVGSWEDGTYRLEVRTEVATAALPIRLE